MSSNFYRISKNNHQNFWNKNNFANLLGFKKLSKISCYSRIFNFIKIETFSLKSFSDLLKNKLEYDTIIHNLMSEMQ